MDQKNKKTLSIYILISINSKGQSGGCTTDRKPSHLFYNDFVNLCMKKLVLIYILFIGLLSADYSVGSTISMSHQMHEFNVCYASGDYSVGDLWKFADYNGNLNGGDYKIIVIKSNATW